MLTGECTAACNYNYKLQLSIASSSRLLLYFFLSRLRGKEETAMAFFCTKLAQYAHFANELSSLGQTADNSAH